MVVPLLFYGVIIINQVESKDECADFIAKEKGFDLTNQSLNSSPCNATDVISLSTRSIIPNSFFKKIKTQPIKKVVFGVFSLSTLRVGKGA